MKAYEFPCKITPEGRLERPEALTKLLPANQVELVEWQQAGLLLPSVGRVHKVATLEKRLVERRLGTLTSNNWAQVCAKIQQLWAAIITPLGDLEWRDPS